MKSTVAFPRNVTENSIATGLDAIEDIGDENITRFEVLVEDVGVVGIEVELFDVGEDEVVDERQAGFLE